jgi:hypothetical protein
MIGCGRTTPLADCISNNNCFVTPRSWAICRQCEETIIGIIEQNPLHREQIRNTFIKLKEEREADFVL